MLDESLASVGIGLFSSGISLLSSSIMNDIREPGETRVSSRKVDSSAGDNTIRSVGGDATDSTKSKGKVPIVRKLIYCSALST